MQRRDIAGKVFGRLTVIEYSRTINKKRHWRCICICGNEHIISQSSLVTGHAKSCGCLKIEIGEKKNLRHGQSSRKKGETKEYRTWIGMRNRCNNTNNEHYGGRGIKVCDRWDSFEDFVKDMGVRPVGYSLERINNDGNYEPTNCIWASKIKQANNKRNNIKIYAFDKVQSVQDWARELKLPSSGLYRWIKRGKTLEQYVEFTSKRLTETKVREIRNEYIPRIMTVAMLSKKYNVPFGTLKDVLSGKSWGYRGH